MTGSVNVVLGEQLLAKILLMGHMGDKILSYSSSLMMEFRAEDIELISLVILIP
jgi:hypothetical protein